MTIAQEIAESLGRGGTPAAGTGGSAAAVATAHTATSATTTAPAGPAGRRRISFVIPVYNEIDNVPSIIPTVDAALAEIAGRYDLEFVFTDNHSEDGTFAALADIARTDPRVRVIRFSRNFGYQKSIRAGYFAATGDCVVQLDADLQDPPSIVPRFLEHWEQGAKVVYGIRRSRREGVLITGIRRLFYRLIARLSDTELPADAGDFRLVDRRIVEELKRQPTASPYLRGEIAALGFHQVGIGYDREARKRGVTKFSTIKLIDLAIDGITSRSVVPLRFASYVGVAIFMVTLGAAIFYAVNRVFFADWPPGFTTTTILLLLSISLNALFLGVIGEYIARIHKELASRADVIVEARLGFGREEPAAAPPPRGEMR